MDRPKAEPVQMFFLVGLLKSRALQSLLNEIRFWLQPSRSLVRWTDIWRLSARGKIIITMAPERAPMPHGTPRSRTQVRSEPSYKAQPQALAG